MAVHTSKRRKTAHTSSSDDDGDDDAGFLATPEGVGVEVESDDGSRDEDPDGHSHVSTASESAEDESVRGTRRAMATQPNAEARLNSKQGHGQSRGGHGRDMDRRAGASAYANGTFRNNAFKMQVDELLDQVRPKRGKREAAAESALHLIKRAIELLPAIEPCSISAAEQSMILTKTCIPFPDPRPPKDARYKLAYSRPVNINVVGSFVLKTTCKPRDRVEVDLVVTMPGSIFEDKDFLNYRYFHKRAFYLARLASGLKRADDGGFSFNYQLLHDDPLRPILIVHPVIESSEASGDTPAPTWQINVIPCVEQTRFAAAKVRPDRDCVRGGGHAGAEGGETLSHTTPYYNSALRADMLTASYLKLLHTTAKRCCAFVDACLLGSVWLRQRGLGSSLAKGGFGSFEWSALIALSLQGGGPGDRPLLSEGYSSYQLLKAVLQLLAIKDIRKQPLVVGHDSGDAPVSQDGVPVLWDAARMHNVLFKVSPWSYDVLRSEARNTLNMLGDQFYDGFDAMFILNVREPLYRYDTIASLPLRIVSGAKEMNARSAHGGLIRLHTVLKRGLSDRVNLIHFSAPGILPWDTGSALTKSMREGELTVAFAENPEDVNRTVDHGPSAEQKGAAAAFRQFWGEKAELRRFKDGSILESVVWTDSSLGTPVLEQIARYLLQYHFGMDTGEPSFRFVKGFSDLIKGKVSTSAFTPLMTHLGEFENALRDLREMPLSIRQIMPADAQLRFSSVDAPPNGKTGQRPFPADVVLQFEGSGRWPDDLTAIQRAKIAFLLKIEEMLQESSDSLFTRIGLENEGDDRLNQAFLEVTYGLDATFRLRIYHDREQTLFERELKSPGADPRSKEMAALGLAKYKRDYVRAPAHTQAIGRLCSRHPALSGSIRLAKQWFYSHLLANHISDEIIELLVARTFVQPWPWRAPSSPQVGFVRTLFWVSRWDWRTDPLIVDLSGSGDLKEAEIRTIQTRFEAWRKLDPALNRVTLFAASNVDVDGTTWTDGRPGRVVAGRLTALAKAACAEIERHSQQLHAATLFSSPLSDFDFVLHINPDTGMGLRKRKSDVTFKNIELGETKLQNIGFGPVESFLNELERLYGSAVVFFHGASHSSLIGGLWSPLTATRGWKVNLAYSTRPSRPNDGDDVQALLNKSAVLSEIARLGGDLIRKVVINR